MPFESVPKCVIISQVTQIVHVIRNSCLNTLIIGFSLCCFLLSCSGCYRCHYANRFLIFHHTKPRNCRSNWNFIPCLLHHDLFARILTLCGSTRLRVLDGSNRLKFTRGKIINRARSQNLVQNLNPECRLKPQPREKITYATLNSIIPAT